MHILFLDFQEACDVVDHTTTLEKFSFVELEALHKNDFGSNLSCRTPKAKQEIILSKSIHPDPQIMRNHCGW